jgi:PAS domain S-box-containing protein
MQLAELGRAEDDAVAALRGETVGPDVLGGRDAIMLVDEAGRVVHVNDEWLLLSGCRPEDYVGKPACEGPVARDCEALDLLRHTLTDGLGRHATVFLRHRRGFQLKLQAQVMPIGSADRGAAGFMVRMRPKNG